MGKYEPLRVYLSGVRSAEVPMRFADIEKVIGAPLPPAAHRHRAWWSNNPSNSVITHAWLDAGYRTERVDMAAERLVFRRTEGRSAGQGERGVLNALRQALGGTVQVAPGTDLLAPAGETWDAAQ